MMNYRILVVEDDDVIAGAVVKHISSWGCEVRRATNYADIMADFSAFEPQLVLLDIGLPYFNGYHWCSEIRRVSKVPVIFISSASDNMNIVMAMNMGADDFIAKPFDLDVLTAKVQAMLRRTYDFANPDANRLKAHGAALDLGTGVLEYEGAQLELTKNELKVLQCLLEKSGHVVSRDELMMRLWQTDSFVDENTLTVNITRLRRRLENIGLGDFIKTRKGLGYIIEE